MKKKDIRDRREYKKAYAETHKEQIAEKNRKNYQENKDKRIEYSREYRAKNREEILSRRHKSYQENTEKFRQQGRQAAAKRRITQYGISVSDYNEIFSRQNGCCAICGIHQSNHNGKLHIDHDHETGIVRGLLCGKCNKALGLLGDSVELLQSACRYLEGN